MAGERWYDGLHKGYDKEHRARDIENNGELTPMRMRGHSAHDWPCDERYETYFERLGLLPFVLQFKRHAPSINHGAMTALIDRWRPETHSFHLSCGEMTVTLEDMAMISGLPINGVVVLSCNRNNKRSNCKKSQSKRRHSKMKRSTIKMKRRCLGCPKWMMRLSHHSPHNARRAAKEEGRSELVNTRFSRTLLCLIREL
ncbi:hypothetical protein CFC21_072881 [Triticum aestivum]|uniref:Aminotransferase-like plant mobile domain-containing protein n=2 Tax=Triticum aestivum TaxID=4565 RepID=A0A3B6LR92_WHEAT|nr:protein MAINTENANCE OF MERISTEMS-like [Triticum aestivum]KAF7066964.1 hypothetical protein CFC21_072881 [Triticum aestivum]